MKSNLSAEGLRSPFAIAVLALLAISAFRFVSVALNNTDLYIDESQYWAWAQELDFGYYSKPPLLAWIIAGATGVCGDGEACVRVPSLFIHLGTSLVIFFIAAYLYDRTTALWASISFATLPGISVSSQIISTDVPLLLAWAVGLYFFVRLVHEKSLWLAVLMGLAIGVGLNAKYAMAYFVLSAGLFLALSPRAREGLGLPHMIAAAVPIVALILPNIFWNMDHDFSTLSHTADNAKWGGPLFHPGKALEFFGAQFGVFGPILFFVLLTVFWRFVKARDSLSDADRLLVAFILPILLIVTTQAFLSRAHANWAAPAYVAASVLVPAWMLRQVNGTKWLAGSVAIGVAVLLLISAATTFAGLYQLPGGANPYGRALGFDAMADIIQDEIGSARAAGSEPAALVSRKRGVTTALLYYGQDIKVPLYAWRRTGKPKDHFQLTRPFRGVADGGPALVVDFTKAKNAKRQQRDIDKAMADLTADCADAAYLKSRTVVADLYAPQRILHFFRCGGYRGAAN